MADYSIDTDLVVYEPETLSQGVADFNQYHALAKVDIDRILKAEWWPGALRSWTDGQPYDFTTKMLVSETDFDPQYLKNPDQLKAASCFRVFGWYAFEILAKYDDVEPDRWEKKKDVYQDRFKEEIAIVMGAGLDYDFTRDGQISEAEQEVLPGPRRTRRA